MKQDEVRCNRGKKTWQYSTMQWKCFLVLLMHLCYSACKRPWLEKWLCACFNQWHALHNCIKPQSGSQVTLCCVLFFSPLRDFPRGCSQVPESSTTICTCAGQSHLEVQGGGGTRKFNSGRKTISTSVTSCSVRSPFCPGKQAAPFFSGAIRKKAQSVSSCVTRLVPRLVLCQLQFSRCWRGRLTLILSVTMFSNYHSLHTNMIAWLAVLFPWQLLWFWLCQSLRSLLRVASNSGSPSRSLFLFFYFPSCVGWLFEVYSLFFTVEKLFKNSCPAPLQCYYLWAQ